MQTKTSAISFDNIRGDFSLIDHECYFICDLDMYTKLYTHYDHDPKYPNQFLIIKFNEDESLSEIYDLGINQRVKRVFVDNKLTKTIGIDNDLHMHFCNINKRYIVS
jgi:hypothetical protein